MLDDSHDLAHELPEFAEKIQDMKKENNHFAKLLDKYEASNKEILRIEKGAEAASDDRLELLKKERLQIKDEMHEMLEAA